MPIPKTPSDCFLVSVRQNHLRGQGCPICQELKQLSKAIAAGNIAEAVSDDVDSVISTVYKDPDTNKYYLLAVNDDKDGRDVTFTLNLPGEFIAAQPIGDPKKITIINGKLKVHFDGYEASNYILVP